MRKQFAFICKSIGFITACAVSLFTLSQYEYLANFEDIDNIVGMLPVVFACVFVFGTGFLLFFKHSRKSMPTTITVSLLVLLSVILFPNALHGNWWINPKIPNAEQSAPDLTVYEPFSKDSKVAVPDEQATLKLNEAMPILDGATALYPVYAAFAQAVFDEGAYSSDRVLCTNTGGAYRSIIAGTCDIAFVATASGTQIEAAKAAGAELIFTPIGREAFVFLAGRENPVDNLTYQQVKNIYSGKTANWKTVGWDNDAKILALQRPEGSGSQTGLQGIMGKVPIVVPQPLPGEEIIKTNSLMQQLSVSWQGVQPALGYSYRYYAATMYANPDTKLLSINGIYPSEKNIRSGRYPFISNFYAVTNGEPKGSTKLLIDWILSPQGQELIEKTGYTGCF